jgi:hypothetical protein
VEELTSFSRASAHSVTLQAAISDKSFFATFDFLSGGFMKRIRIPGVVDLVISSEAGEVASLAQDPHLDRAYGDGSILLNGILLRRICRTLQLGGKRFPTITPKNDPARMTAQLALWKRLSERAFALSDGPAELEDLAAYVRGEGTHDSCGPLAQEVVGRLFNPNFKATSETWSAAVLLSKAPRTMNPILLLWWALTHKVDRAKQLLSGVVGGDLAGLHAIGVAVQNVVNGMTLMRQLYRDPSMRMSLTPELAGDKCIFAPESVIRQPISPMASNGSELGTGTVVLLKLQAANTERQDDGSAFLSKTWSRCPAEQWVPALLRGTWRRACEQTASAPT